jgi:hypothetical protein
MKERKYDPGLNSYPNKNPNYWNYNKDPINVT